jgi:hypothetical protein
VAMDGKSVGSTKGSRGVGAREPDEVRGRVRLIGWERIGGRAVGWLVGWLGWTVGSR